MGGKREIKRSLDLKDREAAKGLIPDMTKTAHALLKQAERDKAAAKPALPLLLRLHPRSNGSGRGEKRTSYRPSLWPMTCLPLTAR